MVGPPRPRGEQAIGPDGNTQRPEACLGGRDPKGPVPPQDACLHPRHTVVNPRDFPDLRVLMEQCNKIWERGSQDVGTTAPAAAVSQSHSPSLGLRRSSSPSCRKQLTSGNRPHLDPAGAAAATATASTMRALDREPRSVRTAAHTRKTSRPLPPPVPLTPAVPPPATVSASITAMSFLPTKNLIFLQDMHNNFRFLVDSDASLSILQHADTAPPTGLTPGGANGKTIPLGDYAVLPSSFLDKSLNSVSYLPPLLLLCLAWIF